MRNSVKGGRRRAFAGLTAMGIGAALLVGAIPGAAGATEEPPDQPDEPPEGVPVDGNPTCSDLVGNLTNLSEFKIETPGGDEFPASGVYDDPDSDFSVEITVEVVDGVALLDFEANVAVKAVVVKSGPGGLLYAFPGGASSATDLASPNDSISHITFCWCGRPSTTTTSTTMPDDTTTTMPETTTTSVADTTTTEAPTTSTTAPGEGTTTVPPAPPTTTPVSSNGGGLPVTGSNTMLFVAIGGVLLVGGAVLVATTRKRWGGSEA